MSKKEAYLFKPYKAEDYVDIAEQSARWIKTTEINLKDGKAWAQSSDDPQDFSDYPMLTQKALYGGSAGIGLFYLRLYEVTKKAEYLSEAEGAASHIIASYEGAAFYEKTLNRKNGGFDKLVHVKNMPGWAAGLHNAPSGQAYFVLQLYKITGKAEYKDFVVKVADDLAAAAKKIEGGLYYSGQGDLCGDGGNIIFFLSVYAVEKNQKYLDTARGIADYLITRGKAAPNGGTYYNVVDLSIIDFPKGVFWVNWAHGTSGVGFLFSILYQATKDEKYLKAAEDAAKYIEGIAVGDENAVLVPYLDSLERGPSTEFYYLSTCHGPAGTSILFHLLYNLTGKKEYLDWTLRLSRGIIKAGAPEQFSRGYWPSQALCCGTPGLLEHFVSVYRLTGEKEFLEYARRTANTVMSQSHVPDDPEDIYKVQNQRRWLGNWWRTIPQQVYSYTGLYIGTSGDAWTLLSLYAAEKGIKLTEIPEYSFFEK